MHSNSFVNSPGLLTMMARQYSIGNKKERANAVEVINEGFLRGRDAKFAEDLLRGAVPFEVNETDQTLSFDYEGTAFREVEVTIKLTFEHDVEDMGAIKDAIAELVPMISSNPYNVYYTGIEVTVK